jgi:hypothetical protein
MEIIKSNNKIILIVLYLLIILVILKYVYNQFQKELYYTTLTYILRPIFNYQSRYFISNFNDIIKPYYKGNTIVDNKNININRTIKNEYSILDKNITNGLLNGLKHKKPSNVTLDTLIDRVVKYIHLDGKPVKIEDLIILDVLTVSGNYFPFFHTDIEWGTFCKSNGFQIWILLEEDEEIKPRGNMFIMETDIVEPSKTVSILNKNKVSVVKNGGPLLFPEVIKNYNSLDELDPKIKYLNAKIGEVFLMNPSVFHCSDPIVKNTTRRAINLRIIHKPNKDLSICDFSSSYTSIIRSKHDFKCDNNFCYTKTSSTDLKYKYK